MELNRVNTGTIGNDSGEASSNQRSAHTSFQASNNNFTLPFRPASPSRTPHANNWAYPADGRSDSFGSTGNADYSPTSAMLAPRRRASPFMFKPDFGSPTFVSDRVTKEQYARLLEQNARLREELEKTKKNAEMANKACRDLATWVLWERDRLMRELGEAREMHRAFIRDEVDQLIAEEAGRLPTYQCRDCNRSLG